MANIENKLKEIERRKADLVQEEKELLEAKKREESQQAKLEKLFSQSGYETPRAFVEALIEKFNIRFSGRKKASASGKTRKRTKVTASVRDSVKSALETRSKNAVSKDTGISYVVVSKIANGEYDHL